jgi:hypothetical protein
MTHCCFRRQGHLKLLPYSLQHASSLKFNFDGHIFLAIMGQDFCAITIYYSFRDGGQFLQQSDARVILILYLYVALAKLLCAPCYLGAKRKRMHLYWHLDYNVFILYTMSNEEITWMTLIIIDLGYQIYVLFCTNMILCSYYWYASLWVFCSKVSFYSSLTNLTLFYDILNAWCSTT